MTDQLQRGEVVSKPETVVIDTLDGFVRALHSWHQNKVKMLQHLKTIPEGTEVTDVKDDGTEEKFVLEGDVLKGFVIGLTVALEEMGELPFEAEVDFNTDQPIITDPESKVH
jgi:hypothetical protein